MFYAVTMRVTTIQLQIIMSKVLYFSHRIFLNRICYHSPNWWLWLWLTLTNKTTHSEMTMIRISYNYSYFVQLIKFYHVINFSNETMNHWLPHTLSVLVIILGNHNCDIIINSNHITKGIYVYFWHLCLFLIAWFSFLFQYY